MAGPDSATRFWTFRSLVRKTCAPTAWAHGPDPASAGDPVADAGWVDTTAAAVVVGVARDARAERIRALVTGGATVAAAAAEVSVNQTSAYRYLKARPRRD